MNKKFLTLALVAFTTLAAHSQDNLRLMTYNIRNTVGMDGVRDFQRVADVIAAQGPDIVALQEVDSMTGRSGSKYVLGELAARTRMKGYFAAAIDYDGGKYGIGILARQEPIRLVSLPLPGREEVRTLLMAEFNDYIFCCTHLSLTEEDRMKALKIIRNLAAAQAKPFYLAGDMNALPDSPFVEELKKDFTLISNVEQATFPASTPTQTIDYLALYTPTACKFSTNSVRVINEPTASDHRPIVADLRIARDSSAIFATKPYLQNPVGGGITVMWETDVPTYSWVEFGTDTTSLQRARTLIDGQALCNNTLHKIRLEGLAPGVKYFYRVCSQEMLVYQGYYKAFGHTAATPFSSFSLPNPEVNSFTALVFNDLHQHTETFRALCKQIEEVEPDFVIFNGDCVDDPANRAQATAFISHLTSGVNGDRVPTFFMRGNHEIRNAYSVGLRDHFDYVGDKTYGAFNWGDTRIVMLDCGEDKPDDHWVYYGLNDFTQLRNDQVDFLKRELASREFKKASCRLLLHHIPLYGNDTKNLCEQLWKPLLAKAPFDVSLNAHTHAFAHHAKGELGNNFPVIVGGGYKMDDATVMVVEKRGEALKIRVMNTSGATLFELNQ